MPIQLSLADLDVVHPLAARYARRLCQTLGRPSHEREDFEQDMLLDLLTRLPGFDPARGTLAAFATVCFQHRASRLATRLRREMRLFLAHGLPIQPRCIRQLRCRVCR